MLPMQQLQGELVERAAGVKRKISELQEWTSALLLSTEQKSRKIARRAKKLPELAKLLQPFV